MIRKQNPKYSYLKNLDEYKFKTKHLHLIPKWWKLLNWDYDSWVLIKFDPNLLRSLDRWWEYFNFKKDSYYLVKYAPHLIDTLPEKIKNNYLRKYRQ